MSALPCRPDDPALPPGDAPVFAEPWQAQAFAMTLQLHQRGLFSWPAALETLVADMGATDASELARCAQAWDQAADRTPHGQPIVLQPADFPR